MLTALIVYPALAFVVVPWAVIVFGMVRVSNALAVRLQMPAMAATLQIGTGVVTLLMVTTGAIITFGALANPEASAKASMLAAGIRELNKCAAYVVPRAAVIVGGGAWLIWRAALYLRPTAGDGKAP